jgi:hypothetical protein
MFALVISLHGGHDSRWPAKLSTSRRLCSRAYAAQKSLVVTGDL